MKKKMEATSSLEVLSYRHGDIYEFMTRYLSPHFRSHARCGRLASEKRSSNQDLQQQSKKASIFWPSVSWERRNGAENGNNYNGSFRDYQEDPFLHSYLTKGQLFRSRTRI